MRKKMIEIVNKIHKLYPGIHCSIKFEYDIYSSGNISEIYEFYFDDDTIMPSLFIRDKNINVVINRINLTLKDNNKFKLIKTIK